AQMDKVTQQNAANAEESASASEELSAQAASMQEVVAQLVAVVGGKTSRTGSSAAKQTAESPKVANLSRAAHPSEHGTGKPHGFGRSDEPFHKIAHGDAKAKPKATPKSAAHKAIPLDPHEDDLKAFNG
ncbi:MAG: hypothetical protein JW955_14635, partial [Sedimentisphaerales bacterium]|nr:hypothetical protein [Sedimentisphaerales bacterium]